MMYWRGYDWNNLIPSTITSKGIQYDNNIYTLDVEATSAFFNGQQFHNFLYDKKANYYVDVQKVGILYIWQFSINDIVLYGRELHELQELFERLHSHVSTQKIVYIHNLSYEFHWLLNIITDFEVFARKERKPMKAFTPKHNIQFRCSYFLLMMPLSRVAQSLRLPVAKEPKIDYNVIRLPCTPLTDEELKYCEHDCLVVYYAIKYHLKDYKYVYDIPLTQTGKIRRVIKKIYKNDSSYYDKLSTMLCGNNPETAIEEFMLLTKVFSGGYTHANADYSTRILRDVYSMDIASSYPNVMICEKFPMSNFIQTNTIKSFDDMNPDRAYIIDITFYNLRCTKSNVYLSISKCIGKPKRWECEEDNGRVVIAKEIRYYLTELDLDIVRQSYDFDYTINNCWWAHKERLDKKLVNYIIELYRDKTTLKGIDEMYDVYMQSKQFINSIFGMAVTNNIRDEVKFDNNWRTVQLDANTVMQKLIEQTKKHKTFMSYGWGVYITAYARHNLWWSILRTDSDTVYVDTDSNKFVNASNLKIFDEYNKMNTSKLHEAMEYYDISFDRLSPIDSNGIHHPIGVFESEDKYDYFITLGAKKYCGVKNGKLEITISGVNKYSAVTRIPDIVNAENILDNILGYDGYIHDISQFKAGHVFDYIHSGRTIIDYIDNQPPIIITDYLGNTMEVKQQYAINLMPTTYKLDIGNVYADYISYLTSQTSTKASYILNMEVNDNVSETEIL